MKVVLDTSVLVSGLLYPKSIPGRAVAGWRESRFDLVRRCTICTTHLYRLTMAKVKITELRQNLPTYLARVKAGDTVEVTVRGRVIARIVPEEDRQAAARKWLKKLRNTARIGDIMSPSGEAWDAERGRY